MSQLPILWEGILYLAPSWSMLLADKATTAGAATPGEPTPFWEILFYGAVLALVSGVLGILLMALGFKVFDWLTPKLDIEKELGENRNIAVALLCAAIILAVSIIVAVVIAR